MSKSKCRKLAAIALSVCMASGVGAAMAINAHTHFAAASADTAKHYAVTENYSATVTQAKPATVQLTEKAGQYVLTAIITDVDGKPIDPFSWEFYDLVVAVNGESLFMNYNIGNHTFTGVIMVDDNATLELSTFTESELSLSITLENLYLGQGNDFNLSNVKIPANKQELKINLDDLSGKYNISVEPDMAALEDDADIYVKVGAVTVELSKNATSYFTAYTGELNFGEGATSLTISTTNAVALPATISLSEVKEYAELPASVDLEMWTAVTYKYTATKTGYFSLNTSSADSMAEVAITFKNDPESFEGVNVTENNFPLYMEAGNVYYFELVLVNSSNGMSAKINTTVENWVTPTITTDVAYPVPVTAAGKDKITMNVVVDEGDYNLSLQNVPFNWYMNNITVIANIGGEEIGLTPNNNYAIEVYLDGDTTISLTTSAAESTTLTLYIATPEVREYITLDKETAITVPAATMENGVVIPGNAIYYLDNAQAGFYGITLSANNNVSVDANWLPAVFKGNTYGGFRVTDNGSEIAIEFYNYNTEATAEFTATVNKLDGKYDLKLGMNQVKINKGATIYYLEGIVAGSYNLAIDGLPAGATVLIDGVQYTLTDGEAPLTITEDQGNRGFVTFMFMSDVEKAITVDVTPKAILELNKATNIEVGGEYTYAAYYMNLEAGTYNIKLNVPEGMSVYVVVGDTWVEFNEQIGSFTVAESGYVALKFDVYNYSAATSFTVEVTKA